MKRAPKQLTASKKKFRGAFKNLKQIKSMQTSTQRRKGKQETHSRNDEARPVWDGLKSHKASLYY